MKRVRAVPSEPYNFETSSDDLGVNVARATYWSAIQVWLSRSMGAIAFVVLGRQLGPAEFGLVALATAVITVLTLVTENGLATYVVRKSDLSQATTDTAFWVSVSLALGLAIGVFASASALAALFDAPGLVDVLRSLSGVLVVAGIGSVPSALLRREMNFRVLALRSSVAALVGGVVAVVLALGGAGVWALVAQALSTAVVSAAILWTSTSWRPRGSFSWSEGVQIFSFGLRIMAIDLLVQSRERGEEFIIAGTLSSYLLGFWAVSTKLVKLVQDTGSQVVSAVATPTFARLQHDTDRLYRGYKVSMVATGFVLFPAMFFLAATSSELVPFVLGDQWARTAEVAQVASLTAAVGVFSYFDRSLCIAVDKLRAELILVFFIVASHIGVVLVLAPYGLRAIAYGILARQLLTLPIRQAVLHRVVGVPYSCIVPAARLFVAAAVAGVGAWATVSLVPWSAVVSLGLAAGVMCVSFVVAGLVIARSPMTEFWHRIVPMVRRLRAA